jgi:glycosyltransferase involved in cell wall biosynthesis
MPTISIIMPVYGVEKYIATAIESVLAQTYPDWELIVVNDGTKDNSRAIALQYAATDSRIKVCDKENGGLSDARNFGLNIAKGQYVHFFDSDDRIAPDFYEQMLKPFIDNSALDFIVSGYNKENFLVNGKTSYEIFRIDESLAPYKLESQYFNYAWNKLFNRDFIERHGLRFEYGLKLIEDIEFMSRVVACSPKYQFVDYFWLLLCYT